MVFIETPTFTRQVAQMPSDEEYRELQNTLVLDPEHGSLIKGGGGLRKDDLSEKETALLRELVKEL